MHNGCSPTVTVVASRTRQLRGGERNGVAVGAGIAMGDATGEHTTVMGAVLAGALVTLVLFGAIGHGAVSVDDQLAGAALHWTRPPYVIGTGVPLS